MFIYLFKFIRNKTIKPLIIEINFWINFTFPTLGTEGMSIQFELLRSQLYVFDNYAKENLIQICFRKMKFHGRKIEIVRPQAQSRQPYKTNFLVFFNFLDFINSLIHDEQR